MSIENNALKCTNTFKLEGNEVSELIDAENGVNYFLIVSKYGTLTMVPRLNRDGTPYRTLKPEESKGLLNLPSEDMSYRD